MTKDLVQRAAVCVAAAILASCAALDDGGATLGTSVVARGAAIALRWNPNHPLDAQLRAVPFRLQADYVDTRGRKHSDTLATARPNGGREVSFAMPGFLAAAPVGPICLYLLPGSNRDALPIRSVSAARGSDTAGFRYLEWEPHVMSASAQRYVAQQLQHVDTEIAGMKKHEQTARAAVAQQKVANAAACASLAPSIVVTRPSDVLEPSEHDRAARRICVRRARNMRLKANEDWNAFDLELLARQELQRPSSSAAHAAPDGYAARLQQAREFLADWQTHYDTVGAAYVPEVGSPSDALSVGVAVPTERIELAKEVLRYLQKEGVAVPEEQRTPRLIEQIFRELPPDRRYRFLAAGLEAYSTCLADARMQLNSKYEAWRYAEQRAPERARQAREYDIAQCRKAFDRHAEITNTLETLATERRALEAEAQQAQSAALPMLSSKEIALNSRTCPGG